MSERSNICPRTGLNHAYWPQGTCQYCGESAPALAAKDAEIERLRDALQAARDWIGDLRGCIGDVEFTTFDMRNPSQVEEETMAKIDAALNGGSDG